MTRVVLALAFAVGALAQPLSLDPSVWHVVSVGSVPLENDGVALFLKFPQAPDTINYLEARVSSLTNVSAIRFDVEIVGNAAFEQAPEVGNTCPTPVSAHVIIDTGEPYTSVYPMGRWWYAARAIWLRPGRVTFVALLHPSLWSDVYGVFGDNPSIDNGFVQALNNAQFVGLTFGGGCFYGHGVSVTKGSAVFRVLGVVLVPTSERTVTQ